MRLGPHLDSLESSSDLLTTLSFSHPSSFQNTLLRQVPITQVIRDAEPHERSLYTASATKKPSGPVESGAGAVLRDREAPLDVLLRAVETVVGQFPLDRDPVLRRVEVLRVKGDTIARSIASLERQVDDQRRKLDDLSLGRSYLDTTTTGNLEPGQSDSVEVTEEMVRAEEEEIARLEQVIEQKSRR
ncbi:protein of unknown function [Taphrina deformans PYCC 5710]|uniref:DASH complex subunit SPC34 n=1 Tax=Taphrina deformans (strain PYCC 5710 / ATCC 11124 / CBS 356.35 / IMI 108563 / JCM 9778 / NBRC 8474) TaxID=1097556 RepID=R4XFM7_TAPDE|nr:protein of unknown function [Taphrina deformans PYCC 5710]|eukprot:CCG82152.1 protein of unknown function [Taphrina deformans PYCC 5710]